jgi:hypothetical protein
LPARYLCGILSENKMVQKPIKVNRSSVTGKFVTEKYANKHTKTTEKEVIKRK